MHKIAIIQHAPKMLEREAPVEKTSQLVHEAADAQARLIVFPEAFVPGYPAWVCRLRPGLDWGPSEQIHQRLLGNAVDLTRDDLAPIRQTVIQADTDTGIKRHASSLPPMTYC